MNFKANATFRPGNIAALEARIVPQLAKAMDEATTLVASEARAFVPVDTGELKQSIETSVEWGEGKITGTVSAESDHAAFVELGTGKRGATSAGAGKGVHYSSHWPGMRAQPYLRPALDMSQGRIRAAFKGVKV